MLRIDPSEAEVVVFKPLGEAKFKVVARVAAPYKWTEWAKSSGKQTDLGDDVGEGGRTRSFASGSTAKRFRSTSVFFTRWAGGAFAVHCMPFNRSCQNASYSSADMACSRFQSRREGISKLLGRRLGILGSGEVDLLLGLRIEEVQLLDPVTVANVMHSQANHRLHQPVGGRLAPRSPESGGQTWAAPARRSIDDGSSALNR